MQYEVLAIENYLAYNPQDLFKKIVYRNVKGQYIGALVIGLHCRSCLLSKIWDQK